MYFDNHTLSSNRNIRQRCQLKYSRHGRLTWNKWMEYDCIFSTEVTDDGIQKNRIEFNSLSKHDDMNEKYIDLKHLQSITCQRGNTSKNDPRDILVLKIEGKKHRLGFDSVYDYSQWKCLLDSVYNSLWDTTSRDIHDEDEAVNMHYESANAMRSRVNFADLATQEILALPTGECELIFDNDKLVLEQRQDKQYTFPRSTIRTLRLTNNEIEFALGTRAPVQGPIRFRFDSSAEARACYSRWNEGITPLETSSRESSGVFLTKHHLPEEQTPVIPPRPSIHQENECQPPRPPPRGMSLRSPYSNTEQDLEMMPDDSNNPYAPFRTLV